MALTDHCRDGDLAALQTYCAQANVTATQVRESNALLVACIGNHLEIARWLQRTFRLTAADARTADNYALRCACEHGRLELARWLRQAFRLTAADMRDDSGSTLRHICDHHDRPDMARLLQRIWGLPPGRREFALSVTTSRNGDCAAYLRSLHAMRWSPARHADFPLTSRRAAYAALLIRERQARERQARAPIGAPCLPTELWLHILSHLPAWEPYE